MSSVQFTLKFLAVYILPETERVTNGNSIDSMLSPSPDISVLNNFKKLIKQTAKNMTQ